MQAYQPPSVFNESIFFDYVPVPTYAGHINRYPFRIVITSSNDNEHVVILDTENSKSYKQQEDKNKWSFLRPETKFLDLNENEIKYVVTKDTKIYRGNDGNLNTISGEFIGVSGYAEFYFIDDIYNYDLAINNKKYSTIIATLQTSGIDYFDREFTSPIARSNHILSTNYSNSLATAKQPHVFIYREPDYIKISENGIRDYINPRWQPANQYTVFTFNWNFDYGVDFFDGNKIKPVLFDKNFNKSLPSEYYKDDIKINCITNKIEPYFYDPLIVKYKDDDGYLVPGYCKTFFNVVTSAQNVKLSASAAFKSPLLYGLDYNSKLWLSNPNAGQVDIVEYNAPHYIFEEEFYVTQYKVGNYTLWGYPLLKNSNFLKANIFNFDVPIVNSTFRKNDSQYDDIFEPSGYHSIDCFAVLPQPYYQAWGIDSDLNMLYKFNTNGIILSSINLLNLYDTLSALLPSPLVREQLSPTSVVLDKDKNIWVTLYDNKYVLNLDSNGNFIYLLDLTSHLTEYNIPNINPNWYSANQPLPDDDSASQRFVEPTFLDIDKQNNIWVTYSNYASGYLTKFNKNNNVLVNISYPLCSCPQDLIVDRNNDVWVALSNNIWNSFGKIEKRNTNGALLSSFGPIMGVNEITLDLEQNLWFTYSYSRIGRIDNKTGEVYTFSIFNDINAPQYFSYGLGIKETEPQFEGFNPDIGVTDINENTDETLLEGIGCDLRGFLYVINSIANQVIVYDTRTLKLIDKFYVNPQGFNYWTPTELANTQISNNFWGKSLQAHGDWTGTKWINKFSTLSSENTTYSKFITGQSVPLNFVQIPSLVFDQNYGFLATTFYKFIQTNYFELIKVSPKRESIVDKLSFNLDFYRINENFDLADYIKSFAITPTLFNSTYLFNKFLPSIYGNYPYQHSDLGIFSYERIANFVINHSDVDTCDLRNLYSLAESVNNKTDDYTLNYPEETKRLMDTVSINISRLFGSTNKNQNYFLKQNENGEKNIGKKLNYFDTLTAGGHVIMETRSLNKFELIPLGVVNYSFIYTVQDLAFNLIRGSINYNVNKTALDEYSEWEQYYTFYEYISTSSNVYSDNIIDWNNPQTTLLNNVTSINDWYGDEKYIDMLFSYNLYRGLNIF